MRLASDFANLHFAFCILHFAVGRWLKSECKVQNAKCKLPNEPTTHDSLLTYCP